jgi:hypothetical protein
MGPRMVNSFWKVFNLLCPNPSEDFCLWHRSPSNMYCSNNMTWKLNYSLINGLHNRSCVSRHENSIHVVFISFSTLVWQVHGQWAVMFLKGICDCVYVLLSVWLYVCGYMWLIAIVSVIMCVVCVALCVTMCDCISLWLCVCVWFCVIMCVWLCMGYFVLIVIDDYVCIVMCDSVCDCMCGWKMMRYKSLYRNLRGATASVLGRPAIPCLATPASSRASISLPFLGALA